MTTGKLRNNYSIHRSLDIHYKQGCAIAYEYKLREHYK